MPPPPPSGRQELAARVIDTPGPHPPGLVQRYEQAPSQPAGEFEQPAAAHATASACGPDTTRQKYPGTVFTWAGSTATQPNAVVRGGTMRVQATQ